VTATNDTRPSADISRPDHSAFPALDGIRAMAVLMVVVTHCAYWTGRYERGPAQGLLARMDFGVALFFVLSGFLLSRAWLNSAALGRPGPSLRVYFWRRAVRILPAYWAAVVVAMLLLDRNRTRSNLWDWVRQFTLTGIYHTGWLQDGLTQMWSLSSEVAFYLVLPILGLAAMALTARIGWRPGWLLGGCAAMVLVSVVWNVADQRGWAYGWTAQFWLPGFLGWFAGGMALAIVVTHLRLRAGPDSRWRAAVEVGTNAGTCWLVAVAVLVIAATPIAGPRAIGLPTGGTAVTKSLLYMVAAVLIVLPVVLGNSRLTGWVFGNPAARWLGLISYSVFTTHLIVLAIVHDDLLGYPLFGGSMVATTALTVPLSILTGWLSYRLVEVPTTRLRDWVRPTPTSTPPTTPARTAPAPRSSAPRS
jgi:peptidoglycan/LPS O-acetylase OafA/YrhL